MTGAGVDRLSIDDLRISRETWWNAAFDEFLWSAFPPLRVPSVLDVGCGIGVFEQRLGPRFPPGSAIIGVDIDVRRLEVAARETGRAAGGTVAYAAADARNLPFHDGAFGASVVILTLQHLDDPVRALSEMRRVTAAGGSVIAVEADNTGQRLQLPHPSAALDAAVAAYWLRVQEVCRPADIAIGPRLPWLFSRAGIPAPEVKGYLVTQTTRAEPAAFVAQVRARFLDGASRYGLEESAECRTLLEALERAVADSPSPLYAIATVPMFLAACRAVGRNG